MLGKFFALRLCNLRDSLAVWSRRWPAPWKLKLQYIPVRPQRNHDPRRFYRHQNR